MAGEVEDHISTEEMAVPATVSDNVEMLPGQDLPSAFALGAAMAQGEFVERSSAASVPSKSSVPRDKVWIHDVGWRVLPSDAQRDQGSYWAWSSAGQ